MEDILKSKWGAEITGHPEDLSNMMVKINENIACEEDFFVCRLDSLYVLRTSRWDKASNIDEIEAVLVSDLRLIRSCINVIDGCGRLRIGTIFEFDEHGEIINQTRSTPFRLRIRRSPSKYGNSLEFAAILSAATSSKNVRDALEEYSDEGSWFEIYKSLEALTRFYGGEKEILAKFPSESGKIKKLKKTANATRHTAKKYDPVKNPMTEKDADEIIKSLIKKTTTIENNNNNWTPATKNKSYRIQNRHSETGDAFGFKPLYPEGTRFTISEDAPPETVINEIDP